MERTELTGMVGHLLRRAQQRHAQLWAEMVDPELTSTQFAVLETVARWPEEQGLPDQVSVAEAAGIDRSTAAELVRRMQSAGWLTREQHPSDSRRRVIVLRSAAYVVVRVLQDAVARLQSVLIASLTDDELRWVMPRWSVLGGAEPDETVSARPGHLLRRAQQFHNAQWGLTVSRSVTSVQFAYLLAAQQHGPDTQASLAHRATLDRSSASAVVARLAARSLIRRRPGEDRRQRIIELTPFGQQALADLAGPAHLVQQQLLAPIEAADRQRVIELLTRVVSTEK